MRLGLGLGLGLDQARSSPRVPLSIFADGSVKQWVRGDIGVTNDGGVSSWLDQSGNAHNYVQATGAARPAYNPSGLNGKGTLTFTGAGLFLANTTLAIPAPGTTPTTILLVLKQLAAPTGWTSGRRIVGGNADSNLIIFQSSSTPQLRQFNGANANISNGAAIGSWVRVIAAFANSVGTDRLKTGATNVATGNAGNNTSSGRQIGASAGTSFGNFELADLVILNKIMSAGEESAFDAYVTSTWGAVTV